MDNRTIDEVGRNEDRLIDKIELLEKENQEYKEVIDKIKKNMPLCSTGMEYLWD